MKIGPVIGCCAAANLYNLGTAHNIKACKDQDEFDHQIIYKDLESDVFVAFSNDEQNRERAFLTAIGFTHIEMDNLIYLSYISGQILRQYARRRQVELKAQRDKLKAELIAKNPSFARRPFAGLIYQRTVDHLLGAPWTRGGGRAAPQVTLEERTIASARLNAHFGTYISSNEIDDGRYSIRDKVYRQVKEQRDRFGW